MYSFEENIMQLGINIPDMPAPLANYVPYKVSDNVVYVSGQGPVLNGDLMYKGKVNEDISIEDGIKAAELCCINIIAALKKSINGDWNRLDSFLKLGGFVNCKDDFYDQPKIINGASDLLVKIFGDQGRHARFAVGSNALPMNISVEIDAIIKIK
ncbi:MAG: RidA family protein [Alphaproteobacteria bacterium]|mgnify:FL=1|tara:strand:+ start:837 stop:1301 length:465 start_codon:yes stop_codon:yes gene_type:complete